MTALNGSPDLSTSMNSKASCVSMPRLVCAVELPERPIAVALRARCNAVFAAIRVDFTCQMAAMEVDLSAPERLRHNLFNHMAVYIGKPAIDTVVAKR